MTDNARKYALAALLRVFSGGYSNIVLHETLSRCTLSPTDKAFVAKVFYGVLERRITLELLLCDFLKKSPPAEVKTVLMMGLYQMLYLDSVPDYAAVESSVSLVRNKSLRGLVNAVLRKASREGKDKLLLRAEGTPMGKYSVSEGLYKAVKDSLGDEAEEFLASSFSAPPLFLRVNTLKTDKGTLARMLESRGAEPEDTILDGALKIKYSGDITELPEYKEGLFFTEDLSSQLAVEALGIEKGDSVGDICAAPGGKSFSAAMKAGAVTAYDIYPEKVKIIKSGAERLGLSNLTAAVQDALTLGGRGEMFDKVICDLPCSGSGVIRRKPEIRLKDDDNTELIEKQRKIMLTAADALKRGGRMVYSTCSVNKAENADNIEWFINVRNDFKLLKNENKYVKIKRNSFGTTVLPSDFGSDGFYFAVLEKSL